MLFLILSLCLISFRHTNSQSPDVVSSLVDISQAVVAGKHLSTELTSYLNKEESRLDKLREVILRLDSALEIFNASDPNQLSLPSIESEAAANPISAFLAIVRLAANWSSELSVILGFPNVDPDKVDSISYKDTSMGVYNEFDSRRNLYLRLKWYASMLPDDRDVQGALDAVIRLQQTYNIPSIEIAEGRILPSSPSPRLSDWHCMKLGLFCYESGDYGRAIEWYNVVLDRLNAKRKEDKLETGKGAVSFASLYDHLSYALGRSGRYKEALEVTKKLLIEGERAVDQEAYIFDDLCRKANAWSPPKSNLNCRYSTPHPYFLIGPLKEELLQEDPPIILWHDFVSQKEVDEIIEIAKPKLRRALVRNPESGVLEPAAYRVTKKQANVALSGQVHGCRACYLNDYGLPISNFSVWLPDDLNELTKRINKRISMATGLSIEHGEELQVANYGLGGYYAPHYDYARVNLNSFFSFCIR
ncbi:unnamed protein product [Rodentolepis nana]|uniref:P4Ha_N domain-containing protein n=1 Tax=Rodentolepis nana TaxID=102285 RepID=A0A0R3T2R8_RODNA|nr:unnamed protein product [Rodentolepis nana]